MEIKIYFTRTAQKNADEHYERSKKFDAEDRRSTQSGHIS